MRIASYAMLALALAMGHAHAQDPGGVPHENIALGVSYTMNTAPNYSHCTDPGDGVQLTDGVYSEGYFWVQPGTVGWRMAKPVIITLDLGEDKPIRGASFNTAAGAAGVTWPVAVYMLVAGDDKLFHDAGDLVALSAGRGLPGNDKYGVHRFWTDGLRIHGRYVAFAFTAIPYGFVDEIEVFAGDPAWLAEPLPGEPIADIAHDMVARDVRQSVARRIRFDIASVRAKTQTADIADVARGAVMARLDEAEKGMADLPPKYGAEFTTILPLNALHEGVFQAQARLWQAQGRDALTLWQSGQWDELSLMADPPVQGDAKVAVHMMRNEFRAGAFNITNAGDQAVELLMRITGLPGGVNPDYITVHEVAWTDTKRGVPVAAALPEATRNGDAYAIRVPSGMTRQAWLTFNPVDVEPGTHEGAIELSGGPAGLAVPVSMRIYPMTFPDQPTLHFGGWDYTNGSGHRGANTANMDALIEHLREHFVDSPWATNAVMPHGEYDEQGNMTTPPDVKNFDEWRERWPGARQYMVFSAVSEKMGRFDMGTEAFDKAVEAWADFWGGYMRDRDLDPSQLALLLVDEPREAAQDEVIAAWAKPIHAANTGIRVWEDPIYPDMSKALPALAEASDVFCPNRPMWIQADQAFRDYYGRHRDQGGTLEFYSCSGPVRALDPYTYHRLQAWTCWECRAQGSYFWAFGDTGGGSSWNEYAAPGTDYTPLFLGPDGVTAGKHMEAAREGIEDYEYLVMLRDAADKAEAAGIKNSEVERARALLAEVPARVLSVCESQSSLYWNASIDRSGADKARIEILDVLDSLWSE